MGAGDRRVSRNRKGNELKCAENDGQTSTGNDVYWRIEGRVDSEEDRESIYQAAKKNGLPASRFIGRAALEAANSGAQIARLEHITQIQEKLTSELGTLKQQLQGLSADLSRVVNTSARSVAHHAETHEQLALAMKRQACLEQQLNESLVGHAETHNRLMAMLQPIETTNESVLMGLEKVIEMHAHMATPEHMATIRRVCRDVALVMKHLGIRTEDEEQPDSA